MGDVEALAPLQEDQANVTHAVIELEAVAPLHLRGNGKLEGRMASVPVHRNRKKAKPGRPVGP